uniref:NADH-ubiquinone oxidoreductase chain 4L n=1 Tax=Zaptychopsis buschii TaxID=1885884 RepID=A0A224AB21_9EUPU|nr:NADH dehydrogenase subunit 4L [Zaptychopsis buschii]
MKMFMFLPIFLLMVLYFSFFFISKHFLSTLLVLESMVLMLLILSMNMTFFLTEGLTTYLFILTLSVCEAAMGLTILMNLVKYKGNDMINTNNFQD